MSKWLSSGHEDANGSLLWQFLGAFSRSGVEYVYLLHFRRLPASRNLEVTLDREDAGTPEGLVLRTSWRRAYTAVLSRKPPGFYGEQRERGKKEKASSEFFVPAGGT